MALQTFKTQTSWSGKGVYVESTARNFKVAMDEPKGLGGSDKAMNPVEMLLSSLGGCMSICAAIFAGQCDVDLKGASVDVEGDLDPDGFMGKNPDTRKGYQEIRCTMHIDSPSPKENIDKLMSIIEERCPVSDTLSGVPVKIIVG
jgi:uncharacterized OsmC-like protein